MVVIVFVWFFDLLVGGCVGDGSKSLGFGEGGGQGSGVVLVGYEWSFCGQFCLWELLGWNWCIYNMLYVWCRFFMVFDFFL